MELRAKRTAPPSGKASANPFKNGEERMKKSLRIAALVLSLAGAFAEGKTIRPLPVLKRRHLRANS